MTQSVNRASKKKSVSYAKWGYIFIIPFFVVYAIFTLYPQVLTIGYSFFKYFRSGLVWTGPEFIGFKNYVSLFTPNDAGSIAILKYLGNTLIMWIICAVPQFVVALLLAVIFTSSRLKIKAQGFFKSVFYMPNLIMASAFGLLFFELFGTTGPVNDMLVGMGILKEPYRFLAYKTPMRTLIGLLNYVMWFGNTTILLMAGIQGIDESMFESAKIDGANSVRVFTDITMPLLKPIFIYVFITSMIGGIQMFDIPQIMTSGKGTPDNSTKTIVMYLNSLLNGATKNFGMAGAVSMVLFIVTGILSIIVFKSMAKGE